jgi:hypothetical protein
VKAWGSNSSGQLGNGSTSSSPVSTPVSVTGLSGITQIAAGQYHSLAINGTGEVFAWGSNSSGQLGNGGTTSEDVPVQMTAVRDGGQALAPGSTASDSLIISQPYASVSPATGTITFASPGVGASSSSQVATVTNTGLVALQFGQAAITGQDGDEFEITGDGCSDQTLAPGSSCVIGLRFNEKVSETNPVATLRILSDSPTSPNTVTLDPPVAVASPAAVAQPAAAKAAKASVTCGRASVKGRTLRIVCIEHGALGKVTLVGKLTGGRRTISTGTVEQTSKSSSLKTTLAMKLPRALKAGRYTLTITESDLKIKITQTLKRH